MAPNAVDRDFRRGAPLKAVSTDIACLPCMDEGFVCMSGILDCQTDVLLEYLYAKIRLFDVSSG